MRIWHTKDLTDDRARRGALYHEFHREDAMSLGVYGLAAGTDDPQGPHEESEWYLVLRGKARFTSGGETVEIAPGMMIHVPAKEPHRFHDIEQDLELLVGFAPAESTP